MFKILFSILFFALSLGHCLAASNANPVLVFHIDEEIGSTAWVHVRGALRKAQSVNAQCVVVHLNTFGGELSFADSIRTAILAYNRPIYAFIDVNAASAGALIATACDSIYMSPGASIGAASVVSGTDGSKMPDKYQSYMRAMMRSTAESHTIGDGRDSLRRYLRDPRIAEAFVDEMIAIPGVVDSAHILTLTTSEAVKLGYCEGVMRSIPEVLERVAPQSPVVSYRPSFWDNAMGGLLATGFRGILILIIIGGLYFELQTPGLGFPSLASVVAAVLYFAPLYIEGFAANWEIILFFVGILLLAAEVFVIPGFGVAGIAGICCTVVGLAFSLVGNDGLSFENVPSYDLGVALLLVGVSMVLAVVLCIVGGNWLFKNRKSGPMADIVLNSSQLAEEGFVGVDKAAVDAVVGQQGVAVTDLRPGGKVQIADEVYDAICESGFVSRGTAVVVRSSSSGQVVVRPVA